MRNMLSLNPMQLRDASCHLTMLVLKRGLFFRLQRVQLLGRDSSGVKAGDTVVVLGQGLVGSLMMQVLRGYDPARIITVDALPLRCELSMQLGADVAVNADETDPVEEVRRLTDGKGADLVIDCVGGYAGVKSFEQAQDMTRQYGIIQLIALYQQGPLPLHSSKMMSKRLVAGILTDEPRSQIAARALEKIRNGEIRASEMVTHRFGYTEAKAAFDLLWNSPGDTLGVFELNGNRCSGTRNCVACRVTRDFPHFFRNVGSLLTKRN